MSNNRATRLGEHATVALGFVIPISTALTNVCMLVIILSWFASSCWREKWEGLKTHPLVPYVLLILLLYLIGAFYSQGSPTDIRHGLTDQLKLLYFPILLWFLKDEKTRRRAIYAIILAMLVTWVVGALKFYFSLPIGLKYSEAAVFKNHIKTNFFMAFAAFLAAHEAMRLPRWRFPLLLLVGAMLFYTFFMSMGRTGYVIMVLLLTLFAWQQARFKGIAGAIMLFCALISCSYFLSPTFHSRVSLLSCEFMEHPEDEPACSQSEAVISTTPTSLEMRQQFLITSWAAIQENFWFGHGTGSFRTAYASHAEATGASMTDNPHNEYVHIWVELGFMGLLIFCAFFYQQWRIRPGLPLSSRHLTEGMLVGFSVGCLANSWLMDFSEIHFWMLLLAIATVLAGKKNANSVSHRYHL